MAVDVQDGATLSVGKPHVLFTAPFIPGIAQIPFADYVVTKDGQRFLAELSTETVGPPMTAVLNWTAQLEMKRE